METTMAKLSKIQIKTLEVANKTGFTFLGDSHFASYRKALMAINGLVRMGYLAAIKNEFGTEYRLTEAGKEYVIWGEAVAA
jgi:hypothetical protein